MKKHIVINEESWQKLKVKCAINNQKMKDTAEKLIEDYCNEEGN